MQLHVESQNGITLIAVDCQVLDAANGREFKEQLLHLLTTSIRVVLDLSAVEFMDSSGCGVILTGLKRVRQAGGDLKICGVTSPVRALFELIRMPRILEIYPSRTQAVEAFTAR